MSRNNLTSVILDHDAIAHIEPDLDIVQKIDPATAKQIELVAFDLDRDTMTAHLITTNDDPTAVNAYISAHFPKHKIYYTDQAGIDICMQWYDTISDISSADAQKHEYEASVIGAEAQKLILDIHNRRSELDDGYYVSEIIRLAYQAGASDLHRQSEADGVHLRMRKDGILKTLFVIDYSDRPKYTLKIKYISGVKMNLANIPQDGRFGFIVKYSGVSKTIDVRVSIMPGLRGANIVMRYLDSNQGIKPFDQIGFAIEHVQILQSQLSHNYGMILVTGPTGSGKTTTLYTMLDYLNTPSRKIITLENPVEYEIAGIQQSQIDESKGYNFREGLEAILRQDPDVILVGEIRDLETAEIAINAALTGHLVLSTLHTNTAIDAVARLLNLGVKPHLLAPSLNMIIGQRLVRKLDQNKILKDIDMQDKLIISDYISSIRRYKPDYDISIPQQIYYPSSEDGYDGRVAVIEQLVIDDNIRSLILSGKLSLDIYSYAIARGYQTIYHDCIMKILDGTTSIAEYKRVL